MKIMRSLFVASTTTDNTECVGDSHWEWELR